MKVGFTNLRPQPSYFGRGKRLGVEFWKERKNQRAYFDWLGSQAGVKSLDDWYNVLSTKLLQRYGGSTLIELSKAPISQILSNAYPEKEWIPWKFRVVPAGYWNDIKNQRFFFDWLGKSLGIKKLDDWYDHLSAKLIEDNGAGALLTKYGTPVAALSAVYPEQNWITWKFQSTPNGFWNDKSNHKIFFDWVGQQLGVKELDDWYEHLSQKTIHEHGGAGLLVSYGNSPIAALTSVYPDHDWKMWKFLNTPRDYWANVEHQRQFFNWLGQQLGVKRWDDWYDKLSQRTIYKHGGRGLLALYGSSPAMAITKIYPDYPWEIWKFKTVPTMFWSSKENQKKYLEWLAKQLNVNQLDDWYKVMSHSVLRSYGGTTLLDTYKSPFHLLKALYPEHRWIPWKFIFRPRYFYRDTSLIREWFDELAQNLHVQKLDDWYRVSQKQLVEVSALHIIKRFGGLYKMLSQFYPEHNWERQKFFDRAKKSSQRWLFTILVSLFPNDEVLENYLHQEMVFPVSKRRTELDIYIPSKALAFEYQGEQHYKDIGFFSPQQRYQGRDEEKQQQCKLHNITLIEVPYWWDKKKDSLVATIKAIRPDITFPGISVENASPIPAAHPDPKK